MILHHLVGRLKSMERRRLLAKIEEAVIIQRIEDAERKRA
jgi:hypothetical protein